MRLAVLLAPSQDRDGVVWLRESLTRLQLEPKLVGEGAACSRELDEALACANAEDVLVVHVSGRVADDGWVTLGTKRAIAFDAVCRAVHARAANALLVAELVHEAGKDDALRAATLVEELRARLTEHAPGASGIVAVRSEASFEEPLAFTRVALRILEEVAREGIAVDPAQPFLTVVAERLRKSPDARVSAYVVVDAAAFDLRDPLALPPPPPVEGAKEEAAQAEAVDEVEPELEEAELEAEEAAPESDWEPREADLEPATELEPAPPEARVDDDKPELEPLLALSDGARERGHHDQAVAGYKAALLVAPTDATTRARIEARLVGSLIALAADAGDYARVIELSRKRVALLEDRAERVDELFGIARTLVEQLHDLPGAVAELEMARALDPAREEVLEALRRAYRVLRRWPELIELTGALADIAPSSVERGARRFAQARIALEQLEDPVQGLPFLEAALEEDPTHDEALEVLLMTRTARGERAELERALAQLAGRLETLGEQERAKDVRSKLGTLGNDTWEDGPAYLPPPPVEEEGSPVRERADSGPRLALELIDDDDEESALIELEALAVRAPTHAPTYERLFAMHTRAGKGDRAYLAALALEELGALEDPHRACLETFRPDGLRMRTTMEADAWRRLRTPGADDVLEALFRAISRAAIVMRVEERRARGKLPKLDPARRHPETSTVSAVRSFYWAARVLGVEAPDVYLLEQVPGDVAAIPGLAAASAIGPGALSGLSTKDLAFLMGRHLSYYRPETAVLLQFPTLQEVTLLVLAAVQLAMPQMPVPPMIAPAVKMLGSRLDTHLGMDERAAMTEAVRALDARGGKVGVPSWIRSVELTAGRVGLLMCGDLNTALTRIRTESRAIANLSADDKRMDLLSFCASRELGDLRSELTVLATPAPRNSGIVPRHPSASDGDREKLA